VAAVTLNPEQDAVVQATLLKYKKGTWEEGLVDTTMQTYYKHHKANGRENPAIVKLSDPTQVRLMDALTEAAEIPYKQGQTEIMIPDKLCNFLKYRFSPEYQAQLEPEQRIR
jgi:hypothetical protein